MGGESSFNVVSSFTRVMLREALNSEWPLQNKILALLCDLLHPSTSASVASSISLLLSPMIAGFYTEGFELRAFQHFVFHLIVSLKYSLLV